MSNVAEALTEKELAKEAAIEARIGEVVTKQSLEDTSDYEVYRIHWDAKGIPSAVPEGEFEAMEQISKPKKKKAVAKAKAATEAAVERAKAAPKPAKAKTTRKRGAFTPEEDVLARLRSGEKISPIAKDKDVNYHTIWKHAQYLVANEGAELVKGKVHMP